MKAPYTTLLSQRLPRYTSYPTAPHFKAIDTLDLVKTWQQNLPIDKPASLYLHIPFCAEMCWYCGCHTKITQKYAPVQTYLNALLQEIRQTAFAFKTPISVSHIHFGGGSPTLLEADDFTKIMKTIRGSFRLTNDVEIAIEIDPRTLTEEKAKAYGVAGVNRASLGVQDIHDNVMKAVGRPQTLKQTQDACRMLNDADITAINFDVMYGFPHQTVESMQETMRILSALKPARVSFFGYAHVPWMKKHMRLIPEDTLPDLDARAALMKAGRDTLIQEGYTPIGIDHYARPSDPIVSALNNKTLHRNFQGYTTDNAETLIGFGASAISQYPTGFTQNEANIGLYKNIIASNEPAAVKYCPMSDDDTERAQVIQHIMCHFETVVPSRLQGVCETLTNTLGEEIINWDKEHNLLSLKKDGHLLARYVASAFDAYLAPQEQKHAIAL